MVSCLDASPQLPIPLSVFDDDPHSEAFLKKNNIITRTPNKNVKDFIFRKGKITKLLTAHEVEQRDGFKKRNLGRKKLDLQSYINSSAEYDILGTGNKKLQPNLVS